METSFEEIRQILKELSISQKETDRMFQKNAIELEEVKNLFKQNAIERAIVQKEYELERAIAQKEAEVTRAIAQKELADLQKETEIVKKEHEIARKETEIARAISQKEREKAQKEYEKQSKETDRKLKELGKQVGGIGERFGSFTEGLAYPSLRKILFKNYGIDNTVANIVKDFPDGRQIEFDAFGYTNGTVNNAVVVEVKTHLQSKHIYEFKKELNGFRMDFPEFKDKHLYGILTTARIVSKELKKEIFDNGLHLAIVNEDVFNFSKNPNAIDFNL